MNPQQTLLQYYEKIMQQSNQIENLSQNQTKRLLAGFRKINRTIQQKLEYYEKLTSKYIEKVQNKFLLSFTQVLEKMGNDLINAQEAYKSIDKQIMANQKCVSLQEDRLFFVQQSTFYKKELQSKSKENERLKEKNFILIKENTGLKEKLFQKVQEVMYLKKKCKNLNKLNHQNQVPKQEPIIQQTKPVTPQKLKRNMARTQVLSQNSRKWASIGRQTAQQKKQKEEEFQMKKKNLFGDIKKQIKTREKINLEAIVNRSSVMEGNFDRMMLLERRKKVVSKNQSYTERQTNISQMQFQIEQKSRFTSTFASNFEKGINTHSSEKRNSQGVLKGKIEKQSY